MASSTITSWQIEGEKVEAVTDLFSWAAKSVDGDCSHEIKRCLLLGRKVVTNLDSILKRRNITLPTKVHIVKAMVFLVVRKKCENVSHSVVSDSVTLWAVACQAPLSTEFSRQEYWSGLPFPSPNAVLICTKIC